MKRFRFMPKLAAAIVSAAMIFSGAVPAFADGTTTTTNPNGGNLTAGTGEKKNHVYFDAIVELQVEKSSNNVTTKVPNKTFSYTVSNGAEDKENNIKAGTLSGSINATAKLGNTKTTSGNKEYAKGTADIDLSNATFNEAGVYHFTITDTSSKGLGNSFSGNIGKTKDLYVSVSNDGSGYEIKDASIKALSNESKTAGFDYTYNATYLKFKKYITGNQSNATKTFNFTLTLNNLDQTVDLTYIDLPDTDTNNSKPATLTPNEKNTSTATFDLTQNSEVIIDNIPVGYGFTVAENKEGYTASLKDIAKGTDTAQPTISNNTDNDTGSVSLNNVNTYISFTVQNLKDGTVPTGVIFAVAPFAIGAVAIAAFVILKVRKAVKQ